MKGIIFNNEDLEQGDRHPVVVFIQEVKEVFDKLISQIEYKSNQDDYFQTVGRVFSDDLDFLDENKMNELIQRISSNPLNPFRFSAIDLIGGDILNAQLRAEFGPLKLNVIIETHSCTKERGEECAKQNYAEHLDKRQKVYSVINLLKGISSSVSLDLKIIEEKTRIIPVSKLKEQGEIYEYISITRFEVLVRKKILSEN